MERYYSLETNINRNSWRADKMVSKDKNEIVGLAEKQATRAFQVGSYPKLLNQIELALGFKIKVEVDWALISQSKGMADECEQAYRNIYFKPLIDAFERIAVDNGGQAALEKTLKKIVITNVNRNYKPSEAYKFNEGVLTVDHHPTANYEHSDVLERTRNLIRILENNRYANRPAFLE